MTVIAIHQPNYIPWLGYFYKIYQSDVFVFLDDVQFSNEGMHNYHYIKSDNGLLRLRIPVIQSFGDRINAVKVRHDVNWKQIHLDQMKRNYKEAPFVNEILSDFSWLLKPSIKNLADLNISIINFFCNKLGITTRFVRSSELNIRSEKEERIVDICKALGGDIYYSGAGAKAYQSEEKFERNGIQLKYSDYKPVCYPQQYSGFQTNVTVLDYLFNCGYEWGYVIEHQK